MLLLLSIFSLPSLFEAQARVNKQPPPVYNSSLYWNVDTGPVPSADILKCRFEKDCCWSPTVNSSKWYLLQEQENKEALMKTFNLTSPSDVPKGNHLATVLAVRENKLSIFRSCSFCAHRKITVKFRYWITRFVKLQVCWHDAFFESQLEHELQGQTFAGNHCRTVDPTHQPGPLRVDFFVPPGTIVEIVFVVSNTRRYYGGGMVILDDLSVGGRLCGENRKTRRPEPFTTAPVTIRKDTPAPDPFEQLFGRDFAHFLDSDFSTLNEDVTNAPTTTKTPTTFVESGAKLRSTARLIRVATPQANSTIWGPRRSVLDSNGSPTFRRKLLSSLRRPFPSLDQKLQKSAAPNASSAPRLPPKNLRQKDIRRPCATPGACTFEFGACNYANSGAIRSRALFRVFTAADDNRGHPFGLTGISDA
uniref:MAM domain-containing protein n=1 Tax=Plectus sambesii TaxID=2011161 RepID=A0A914UW39_9BILA